MIVLLPLVLAVCVAFLMLAPKSESYWQNKSREQSEDFLKEMRG